MIRAHFTLRSLVCVSALFCALSTEASAQLSLSVIRCMTDEEVAVDERSPYEQAALSFARTLLGDKPEDAYERLSNEASWSVARSDLVQLGQLLAQPGSLHADDLQIAHSYRVSMSSVGEAGDQIAVCTAVAHGSTSNPEGILRVAATAAPLQAHVIIEGDAQNNTWNVIVWLLFESDEWRIQAIHALPVTILDKSAEDIRTLAHEQGQRDHSFNAFVLLNTARQLTYRGPSMQLGLHEAINEELAKLERPADLAGPPPFFWGSDDKPFRVINVGPLGFGTTFALIITHEPAQWGDDAHLEQQNRSLLEFFRRSHPEYADVFDAVVIEAAQPGGRERYRTVDPPQSPSN